MVSGRDKRPPEYELDIGRWGRVLITLLALVVVAAAIGVVFN